MFRKKFFILTVGLVLITAMLSISAGCAQQKESVQGKAPEVKDKTEKAASEIKVGIVTFLSGPPSSPFGIPGRNAAEILIEHLNNGKVPPPYNKVGIGGKPIKPVFIDEAGGAEKQVAELKRLILDEKVDLVIGYISSADALAVAPVANELKKLLVVFDAGTHQLFEENDYKYVFRTAGHQILDNVGAARYVLESNPDLKTIAGINQDYAWGHDSWNAFRDAILALKPEVKVVAELFPKLYAGDYSSEISALLSKKPDVVHTSLWGGDMEGFFLQSIARGLHKQSQLIFTPGDTMLPRLGADVPPGIVILARGPHGALGPKHELDKWFTSIYAERFSLRPVYPSYHMAQAILGVKAAYEKAMAAKGGEWPTTEEVIKAFEHLEFDTPSGVIKMAIGKGHQAVEPVTVGITGEFDQSTRERKLEQVKNYSSALVNPPDGIKSLNWIAGGLKTP
ncbi:MAG: ABC transporter substrate-binding protein [Bacillota bacterium]